MEFMILKTNKPLTDLQKRLINSITEGSIELVNTRKIMDEFTMAATIRRYGISNNTILPLYYFIDYIDIGDDTYIVVDYTRIKSPGRVYFSSMHNANSAIEAVGEDRLIKYYRDLRSERIG